VTASFDRYRLRALTCSLAAAFALCAAIPAAYAKDDDCILDHCADREPAPQKADSDKASRGGAPPGGFRSGVSGGDFDFYVLALSWSSGFCEFARAQSHYKQCDSNSGLGFVVHGLWPQYERGFPSDCDGPSTPSRISLEGARGVFLEEGLARYEWRKHGTCSGKSPSDYFADVARAKESVTIPQGFVNPKEPQTFAPIDIQRAFIAANPRLRPGMIAVGCRKGVLQDVRICFSKDLREFHVCPEVARQACRSREIMVPPPL
jgi:ribonuclease T2